MISARLIFAIGASFLLVSCNREVVPEMGSTVTAPQAPGRVRRAVYPYSVIPGGVKDRAELDSAVRNDTAVAGHYRDMVASSLQPKRLPRDEFAYVSFRQNGRMYWTSRKVRIAAGELVLANGSVPLVRGRCGNRISRTSKTPVVPADIQEPLAEMLMTPVPESGIPYDIAVTLSPAPSGDPVAIPEWGPLVPIARFDGPSTEPDFPLGLGLGSTTTDLAGELHPPGTDTHHVDDHNPDPQDGSGSPVPEPSCLVLTASGALMYLVYQRSRAKHE